MKNISARQRIVLALLLSLAFVLGALSQRLHFLPHSHHGDGSSRKVRERIEQGEYQFSFINPLLECEVAEGTIDSYKENFRADIDAYIEKQKRAGLVSDVAVYFRDLNNGPMFGVQEDVDFIPASLLKVTIMMAYLKLAEEDPTILDKELLYETPILPPEGGAQLITPKKEIVPGNKYTIRELIERAIIYSDNPAVTLLIFNLDRRPLQELYDILGARDDVLDGPTGRLTVKEYSAFFRVLFNSSYLSRKHSEYALELLTKTEFSDGLVLGVPKEVVVAHKFGEGGTHQTDQQIHDCGIIYYPDHPYLLCVMSRGKDIKQLKNSIANISGFVYKKIDSLYREDR